MSSARPPRPAGPGRDAKVDFYGATYRGFAADAYAAVRRETFGEDIGQSGWITCPEQDRFIAWLALRPGARVLDVGCGSGGPALRIARLSGARVTGVDVHADAIEAARTQAKAQGLVDRTRFERADAGAALPFPDGAFDAVICVDAVNHLPDRSGVLREWARLLAPGGRALLTDPIVVTGPLTNEEIAVRGSIGFFLFVPPGTNERAIRDAALELEVTEDLTPAVAEVAGRWQAARAAHAEVLRRAEGEATFEGQQTFLEVAARLAAERRLSRQVFVARKPA